MVRTFGVLTVAAAIAGAVLVAGSAGPAGAAAAPPAGTSSVPGGAYVAVTPTRVLDTRSGLGAVRGATRSVRLRLAGMAGVPTTGAAAVVLNVTVTAPVASGYLSVSPTGTTTSSSANFRAGQTVAQLVTTKLGVGGDVQVRASARTQVVADVVGWFTDRDHAADGATYRPVTNRRVLDTRGSGGPLGPGVPRRITLPGAPTGAVAAVVDVTAVRPSTSVYVTAWGSGTRPATSTLNAVAREVRSNRAIVPVAPDGTISVVSNGRTDVVVDLNGWFAAGAGGAYFVPTDPVRLTDSRRQLNFSTQDGSGTNAIFTVADRGGIPPNDAMARPVAAWLTVTVVSQAWTGWAGFDPTTPGSPADQPLATTSDINFLLGTTSNAVLGTVGQTGMISRTGRVALTRDSVVARVELVVDSSGFFVDAPQSGLWTQGATDSSQSSAWNRALPGAAGDVVELAGTDTRETAAMLRDGTVQVWHGTQGPTRLTDHAVHIRASTRGIFVLRDDGTVWTDDSWFGAHGDGLSSSTFAPVVGLTGAVSIDVVYTNAAAVLRDGSVVVWGGGYDVVTPAPSTPPGPVAGVGMGVSLACVALRDGRVGVRVDGSHFVLSSDIGVLEVVGAGSGFGCDALDASGRVHQLLLTDDGAISDVLLPGPTASNLVVARSSVAFLGGGYTPGIRILATDGTVWDRVVDAGGNGRWVHVDELDGAAAIGGGWSLVTWVPPVG